MRRGGVRVVRWYIHHVFFLPFNVVDVPYGEQSVLKRYYRSSLFQDKLTSVSIIQRPELYPLVSTCYTDSMLFLVSIVGDVERASESGQNTCPGRYAAFIDNARANVSTSSLAYPPGNQ
jgi:hypothetical protein